MPCKLSELIAKAPALSECTTSSVSSPSAFSPFFTVSNPSNTSCRENILTTFLATTTGPFSLACYSSISWSFGYKQDPIAGQWPCNRCSLQQGGQRWRMHTNRGPIAHCRDLRPLSLVCPAPGEKLPLGAAEKAGRGQGEAAARLKRQV